LKATPLSLLALFTALVGAAPRRAHAQVVPGVDSVIARHMSVGHVPGLVAALVDSGRVIWHGAYGLSNVAARTPATNSTPFQIASVSKTITGTVLMMLHAEHRFRLDDDINAYLPFPVRNPRYPTVPITFRELLIHRASIDDNMKFYGPLWGASKGDNLMPLGSYLRDYLTPKGHDYDAANFLAVAPGDTTEYCNTCYALLGYLAEVISGVPFARLSDSLLFRPLGMRDTHWFVKDFAAGKPATPYRYAKDTGWIAYGQNGYPDWPAGTLRTSLRDLSRFLTTYVSGGAVSGRQVIPASVINDMAPPDLHTGFLTWWPVGVRTGAVLYAHNGGDNGVRTTMAFTRRDRRGVIVLTNGEAPVDQLAAELYARMVESRRPTNGGSP
jgi:CubicO group peptidase (beta-lactamase class C family)